MLATTLWLSMLVSFGVGLGALGRPTTRPVPSRAESMLRHPLAQLFLVCLLLYANQVLFSAFVLRVHGGSPAFIAHYIPGPWFAIGGRDPFVRWLVPHIGDGRWLSFSVLRVQAFLELPFTMFAYLAVARLYGQRIYWALTRPALLGLAAVSFSVTFSIIELGLPNPFTHDDLVLRACSALVTPMYIAWIARKTTPAPVGPRSTLGLLAALAGAGAIVYLVLVAYDCFLLYNLGHLASRASSLGLAVLVGALASIAAPRLPATPRASVANDLALGALRAFTLLFFVPSLAIRYSGASPVAWAFAALLVVVALVYAAIAVGRRAPRFVALALPFALAAGTAAAFFASSATSFALPELVLARVAFSFLACTIVILRGLEIALCWAPHETKADADEA